MANVKILGTTAVLTTNITKDVYKRVEAHAPDALMLKDEKDTPIFRLGYDPNASEGSLRPFGAFFNGVDEEGKLTAQFTFASNPPREEQKRAFLEVHANAIDAIRKIENNVAEALVGVDEMIESVADAVTVI